MCLGAYTAMAEALAPDDIEDTMTAEDGVYELAFVTDVGQLKDRSFNEGTWNGVKLYAAQNGMSYKYYQPANGDAATDDDRYDAMKAAAEGGAKVVVCAGFLQGNALTKAAIEFPDTNFVFIDGWVLTDEEGNALTNVAPIAFKEEQSGYFAGYAIVRDGFTKLGFSGGGGGTNPACCRYGYGFVQGAEAAAKEMGVDVEIKYSWSYGNNFSASTDLQTMISGWYETGTEIVFACGGSMFSSITAAASANDAYVVGVDVDQSYQSDTVVTSALKGLVNATTWAIGKNFDGTWEEIGGVQVSLGANDDAVGLPTETWSLESYTIEEYEATMQALKDGTLVVDDTVYEAGAVADLGWERVTVDYIE
ncbi:MAG TPA: BMP family ABC transporter substrate-binding protein [Candidatus Limiplasma stercoravium]|nr:BMP family ABC transporter substrate-binding protein [Candidatus Limiplasma stercoravium]